MAESSLLYVTLDPFIGRSERLQKFTRALVGPRATKTERRLARLTVVDLLCWAGQARVSGHLGEIEPWALADVVEWDGDPGRLVKALLSSGWLIRVADGFYVEGWDRHAGRAWTKRRTDTDTKRTRRGHAADVRARDRERKRKKRAIEAVSSDNPECPSDIRSKSPVKDQVKVEAKDIDHTHTQPPAAHRVIDVAEATAQRPASEEVPGRALVADPSPSLGTSLAKPATAATEALAATEKPAPSGERTLTYDELTQTMTRRFGLPLECNLRWAQRKALQEAAGVATERDAEEAWQDARAFAHRRGAKKANEAMFVTNLGFVLERRKADADRAQSEGVAAGGPPRARAPRMSWQERKAQKAAEDSAKLYAFAVGLEKADRDKAQKRGES